MPSRVNETCNVSFVGDQSDKVYIILTGEVEIRCSQEFDLGTSIEIRDKVHNSYDLFVCYEHMLRDRPRLKYSPSMHLRLYHQLDFILYLPLIIYLFYA